MWRMQIDPYLKENIYYQMHILEDFSVSKDWKLII